MTSFYPGCKQIVTAFTKTESSGQKQAPDTSGTCKQRQALTKRTVLEKYRGTSYNGTACREKQPDPIRSFL